jgi:hypothetical protein
MAQVCPRHGWKTGGTLALGSYRYVSLQGELTLGRKRARLSIAVSGQYSADATTPGRSGRARRGWAREPNEKVLGSAVLR